MDNEHLNNKRNRKFLSYFFSLRQHLNVTLQIVMRIRMYLWQSFFPSYNNLKMKFPAFNHYFFCLSKQFLLILYFHILYQRKQLKSAIISKSKRARKINLSKGVSIIPPNAFRKINTMLIYFSYNQTI